MSEDKKADVIVMDNYRFVIDDLTRSGLVPVDFNLVPSDTSPALTTFTDSVKIPVQGSLPRSVEVKGYSIRYPSPEHEVYIPDFQVKRFENHPDHKYEGTAGKHFAYWASAFSELRKADLKFIVEGEKKALAVAKYLEVVALGIRGCWGFPEGGKDGEKKLMKRIGEVIKEGDIIIVLFDGDFMTHPNIRMAAGTLARQIAMRGATPRFIIFPDFPDGRRMGADDWIMSQNSRDVEFLQDKFNALEIANWHELPESPTWMAQRLRLMTVPGKTKTAEPTVLRNEENTALIMRDLFGEKSLFTDQYKGPCFAPWGEKPKEYADDTLDSELYRYIERSFGTWTKDAFRSQRRAMVGSIKRNMLGEHIESIKWDKKRRIDTFLISHFSAADTPYVRKVSKGFLLGAIARCFNPGIKWDHVMILEGGQNVGKTHGLEKLSYQYFANITMGGNEADLARKCSSNWFNNCDELDHLNKVGREAFKSWSTSCFENWVPKYIEYAKETPRAFIITGTTNESAYLDDPTGARRYWPVQVTGAVDIPGIIEVRNQLWAEALDTYRKAGPDWWKEFEDHETGAKDEQAMREHEDPLANILEAMLATHNLPTFKLHDKTLQFVTYHWLITIASNANLPQAKKSTFALNDAIKRVGLDYVKIRAKQIDMESLSAPCRDGSSVTTLHDHFVEGHIPDQFRVHIRKSEGVQE